MATVVDRIGPDYIVDVGNDASDWDTIEISADEVVCKAIFEKTFFRKSVEVTDIGGKTLKGIVDDIYHDDEDEDGVLSLLLLDSNTDGLILYKEYEVERITLTERTVIQ